MAATQDSETPQESRTRADTSGAQAATRIKEIGGYEIIGKLGAGAMGAVYKARQKSLDRVVALKILPPRLAADKTFVERFRREARASATLNHPNIVQGIDVGEEKGLNYFAMELIDGETLYHRFKREGPLPYDDVLEIGRQTALALAHAHAKGIIHRDIKPENIMLAKTGTRGGINVKVMDLGLARAVEDDASMTQSGTCVGTPYYIAPEQARGDKNLGPPCDLYALAGTLLHVYSGKQPYEGETSAVIMMKHLQGPLPNLKAIKPDMPPEIAAVLKKLFAKKPDERYPSAEALAEDFERMLHSEAPKHVTVSNSPSRSGGPHRPTTKSVRTAADRDPDTGKQAAQKQALPVVPIAAGVIVLLGVVVGVAMSGGKKQPIAPEKPPVAATKPDPAAAPPASAVKTEDPAVAKAAAEAEKQKKLEDLHKAALTVAEKTPADLDSQERAWTALKKSGGGSNFEAMADEKLLAIGKARKAADEAALKTAIALAAEQANASDFDAALATLAGAGRRYQNTEWKAQLEAAANETRSRAQSAGDALLKKAADFKAGNNLHAALEACSAAVQFKFAPVADAARKEAGALKVALESARMAQESAAAERVAALAVKLRDAVVARKYDDAEDALSGALKDKDLAVRAKTLKAFQDGLKGLADIQELAGARLASEPKGVTIQANTNIYHRFENGRLHFTLKNGNDSITTNKPASDVNWNEWLELSGLRGSKSADVLKAVPPEKIGRLGGILALANEVDPARALFERDKSLLALWDETLDVLQAGALEGGAAACFRQLVATVKEKQWPRARSLHNELTGEKFSRTKFVKEKAVEIAFQAGFIDAAELEADAPGLETVLKGKLKARPDGMVELSYDFEDPAQLADFKVTTKEWWIENGKLKALGKPNDSQIWLTIPFVGEKLEVTFEGEAPMDFNCLLGPEIKPSTTAGYSFRFGRTKNKDSEVIDAADKKLAVSDLRLAASGKNAVSITRQGNLFTGQMNGPEKQLQFTLNEPLPTRFVSLQTWENAWYDNLRIVGKLDSAWVKEQRLKAAAEKKKGADAATAK